MKTIIVLFVLSCFGAQAQTHVTLDSLKPPHDYDNIHIEKLSDDLLQTTFVIWVKKNVRAHYHGTHSENILVLEGKARMMVDGKAKNIKKGDYLNFGKGVEHAVLEVTSRRPLKVISVQSPQFVGKDRIFVDKE